MDDLISRQDAIDAVKSYWKAEVDAIPEDTDFGTVTATCDLILKCNAEMCKVLDGIPSAQPEPKQGRWIEDAEAYYTAVNGKGGGVNEYTPFFTDDIACSECLALFSVINNEAERFDYCPNCGADMRGKQDE